MKLFLLLSIYPPSAHHSPDRCQALIFIPFIDTPLPDDASLVFGIELDRILASAGMLLSPISILHSRSIFAIVYKYIADGCKTWP